MNWDQIGRELVRALRGRKSQAALSRHLGFKTNVLYAWESGRNSPTASQVLDLARRARVDPAALFRGFYRVDRPWIAAASDLTNAESVRAFLVDLRGSLPMSELSGSTGLSRFALSRIFKGEAQPKIGEFLHLIQVCTRRLLDFIGLVTDPEQLPSVAELWARQQARRRAATRVPWSPALRCALELASYRTLPRHVPGWLAERLHIDERAEAEALELLVESGQVRWNGTHYVPGEADAVELSEDKAQARARRSFWSGVATERSRRGDGMSAYNVCGVSAADLVRLKALQRDYLSRARAIIARSGPVERVALVQVHVLDLTARRES